MTVYLDLVMGLNFLVDLLLLLGTNRLSGFPPGLGRSSAAAALGAAYAGACMLPGFRFLGNYFWRMVFLALIGTVAFGMNRSAWKRTGVFIILSMAMGGIAHCTEKRDFPVLVLSGVMILILCRVGFGNQIGGREYVPVIVTEGEKRASVMALKDTGNTLRDPVTGEQVLVLGPAEAKTLLNLNVWQLRNPVQTLMENPGRCLRLIPYQAVGQSGGMLLGKRFSDVRLGNRKASLVIGFSPEVIGNGEVYQALAGGIL